MNILIVEDEHDLAEAVKNKLKREGYFADTAFDGNTALDKIFNNPYDLIILDVMLPKRNGFEILSEIRSAGINSAVIMLTARGSEEDKLNGFNNGADDYLTKPFLMSELLARVKALLRRVKNPLMTENYHFSNLTLLTASHELSCGDSKISLCKKEFQMLEIFMVNKKHIISKEYFIEKIWGYDTDAEYNLVEVYVSFLRKKLNAIGASVSIKAVRGTGYMLTDENC